jgi:broad specificity phosphatase PhoE
VAIIHIVQHGEKERLPGDPGLTARGREQAALAAEWLRAQELTEVWSSPLRRARETAAPIADAAGLAVAVDARLTERMNWDGAVAIGEFLDDWALATADRDFEPRGGDSSRQAGERFRSFVADRAEDEAVLAVACHGGITVDLLRTLLGNDAVPSVLLREGVPSGAITTLDGLEVAAIAATSHLTGGLFEELGKPARDLRNRRQRPIMAGVLGAKPGFRSRHVDGPPTWTRTA